MITVSYITMTILNGVSLMCD